jgi:hypothetical protein
MKIALQITSFIDLVAERLLCLQMNTDGQVQKCIFEVLHRETTNVVVVSGFPFSCDFEFTYLFLRIWKLIFLMVLIQNLITAGLILHQIDQILYHYHHNRLLIIINVR